MCINAFPVSFLQEIRDCMNLANLLSSLTVIHYTIPDIILNNYEFYMVI